MRFGRLQALALDDDLSADIRLRLQQDRDHVAVQKHTKRQGLQRLRPPISPPSTVTVALFDIFCGLNGATFRPRRTAALHRPATSIDLPTFEPVPWIISARPIDQNSMPLCAFTPSSNGCFIIVISVTRSAASINSGLALRPVRHTCVLFGFSVRRKFTTSSISR